MGGQKKPYIGSQKAGQIYHLSQDHTRVVTLQTVLFWAFNTFSIVSEPMNVLGTNRKLYAGTQEIGSNLPSPLPLIGQT